MPLLTMAKAVKSLIFILALALIQPAVTLSGPEEAPVLRALLVSCDYFPDRPGTHPAAKNNVSLLSSALERDERGYSVIRQECDTLSDVSQLSQAVLETFSGAREGDISLFYISTHGVYSGDDKLSACALALSDGQTEELLTAEALRAILDQVPGTKVLILDACNAGAMIGKGLGRLHNDPAPFSGPDYKVLCSAGGSEESWYWGSVDDSDPDTQYGAGYFTTVLADIFCFEGYSPADRDRDESVTLREAYLYLKNNYCASSPQVYPEFDDSFEFFRYQRNTSALREGRIISDLACDGDRLSIDDNSITFTYTQWSQGQVYYQLIYYRAGRWDWENAQMILDTSPGGRDPGRKERTLTLGHMAEDDWGYIMLLVITRPENLAVLQCSKLIGVEKKDSSETPKVFTLPAYFSEDGREGAIYIRHEYPCAITVSIINEDGQIIRRLQSMVSSRPMPFKGSMVYWDGLDAGGEAAPPGEYRAEAALYTADDVRVALSSWFGWNMTETETTGD